VVGKSHDQSSEVNMNLCTAIVLGVLMALFLISVIALVRFY
jgi:hypothetical protein